MIIQQSQRNTENYKHAYAYIHFFQYWNCMRLYFYNPLWDYKLLWKSDNGEYRLALNIGTLDKEVVHWILSYDEVRLNSILTGILGVGITRKVKMYITKNIFGNTQKIYNPCNTQYDLIKWERQNSYCISPNLKNRNFTTSCIYAFKLLTQNCNPQLPSTVIFIIVLI